MDLYRVKERYTVKLRMLMNDPSATNAWPSLIDRRSCGTISGLPSVQGQCWMNPGNSQSRKADVNTLVSSHTNQRKDAHGGSNSQHATQSGLALERKKRDLAQVSTFLDSFHRRKNECSIPNSRYRDL